MSPAFQALLERCAALPGLGAFCLRGPDLSFHHHLGADWFKPPQLQKMLSQLAAALDGLREREINAVHACWVFEHARIFVAQRDDGTVLALFAENRSSLPLADYQEALDDFIQL